MNRFPGGILAEPGKIHPPAAFLVPLSKSIGSVLPSPLARQEFGRSWRVVVAAMLGLGFGAGASLYWFGVLIGPLTAAFGWSTSAISGWALVLTVSRNVVSPLTGLLADRFGARRVALWSVPLVALGFIAVGLFMNALWMLYFGALAIGLVDSAWSTYTRTVNSWFDAGRGLALGLAFCGAALTSTIGPRILQMIVDAAGWRIGFIAIGIMALLPFPFVYGWLYERRDVAAGKEAAVEPGYRMSQALRLPTFWLFGGAVLLYFLYFTGVQFNLMPFLTSTGLSRAGAATYAGILGLAIFLGKLCSGAIFDRLHAPYVLASLLVGDIAALGLLAAFGSGLAVPALVLIGFAHGAVIAGVPYCTAKYFGLKFFGGISGLTAILICFSALGPLLFSLLHERVGNYRLPLYVSGALDAGAATLLVLLGRHAFLPDENRAAVVPAAA